MKRSKEYYLELMDGLWHAARGGAMLAYCAGREVVSAVRRRIEDGSEKKSNGPGEPGEGGEEGKAQEVVEPEVVGSEVVRCR